MVFVLYKSSSQVIEQSEIDKVEGLIDCEIWDSADLAINEKLLSTDDLEGLVALTQLYGEIVITEPMLEGIYGLELYDSYRE